MAAPVAVDASRRKHKYRFMQRCSALDPRRFRRARARCATLCAAAPLFAAAMLSVPCAAQTTPYEEACIDWLDLVLQRRGIELRWVELTAADGPSVVDAAPESHLRSMEVVVAVRGHTAHVEAPFLGYREARRLAMRAARVTERPFRCALATEVALASAEEDRMRAPLALVALCAAVLAFLLLRRPRIAPDQNAK